MVGVEWISGELSVQLKFEKHCTASLESAHPPGAGNAGCVGQICPGGFLTCGEGPVEGVGCVKKGSDFISGVGLRIDRGRFTLGDGSCLTDIEGDTAAGSLDRVDVVEIVDDGHLKDSLTKSDQ